jgi:hypothetical protein
LPELPPYREALQKLLGDNKKARDFSREVIPEAIRSGMKGEWVRPVWQETDTSLVLHICLLCSTHRPAFHV